MELIIKSIYGTRNLKVNANSNVINLKKNIENLYGAFPDEQQLFFGDVRLDSDNNSLISYGIRSTCEIVVNFNFSEFTVIVSYNKQTQEIKVNGNDTVLALKNKIQTKFNKPAVEQSLLYKDKAIEDNERLSIYGLTDKSVIILVDKITEEHQTLIVRMNEKDCFNIDYVGEIPVSDVLKQVEAKSLNKNMEHNILLNNKVLSRNDTIKKTPNSVFQSINIQSLIVIKPSTIQLFVLSFDKKTIAFQISKKAKCIELKQMVSDKLGISVDLQMLSFHDMSLENDKSLEFYGLADKSVINLTIRLRGG